MTKKTIRKILKDEAKSLLAIDGVVGIAEGRHNNNPCIKVYVAEKQPELVRQIPQILKGYEVIIEETGKIRALNNSK